MLRVSVGLAFQRARLQYVYSILRGKDLKTGEYSEVRRDEQFDVLKQSKSRVLDLTNWHEFLKRSGKRATNVATTSVRRTT